MQEVITQLKAEGWVIEDADLARAPAERWRPVGICPEDGPLTVLQAGAAVAVHLLVRMSGRCCPLIPFERDRSFLSDTLPSQKLLNAMQKRLHRRPRS